MTTLSEKVARLSPEQRRLLEARLRKKGLEIDRFEVTRRSEERDAYPLTFAQERLWFLYVLDPESSAYHVTTPLRFRGPLDIRALESAMGALVERHEALRTTFATRDDEPVQIVHPAARRVLPEIDLTRLDRSALEYEVRSLASEHSRRPFDLERGPLLRTALLRLASEEHALLLVVHHIVSDGWSLGIFYRETLAFYEAFRNGRTAADTGLPDLPVQYVDFALWQRRWLKGEVYEAQLSYWKEKLHGVAPLLELPTDRPRPSIQSFRGSQVPMTLPPALTGELRALSRTGKLTLFVTLLAAFQVLLARWSGCRDVVVGSPIANRQRRELEGVIGFFANTLVLRGDVSGDPTFRDVLEQARQLNAEAHAHQDLPFENLIDELRLERSLEHNPLFQVALALQVDADEGSRSALGDLEVRPQASENPVSMFDLTLMLTESPRRVTGDWIYSSALFDRTTIAALNRRFAVLLRTIIEGPDRRLSELSVLTDAELHQLLVEWNEAPRRVPRADTTEAALLEAYRSATPVHELFSASADRCADTPAVRCNGEVLTFGCLDAASNRLGRHLRGLGLEPEGRVGILLERSISAIVAILGTLKAGGAWVPFEPGAPAQRLEWLIADSGVGILVTRRELAEDLPGLSARVVDLEADCEEIAGHASEDLEAGARSESLAYVLYTSGSTGRPKGVACSHRGVLRLLAAAECRQPIRRGGGGALWTSLTFDVSVYEVFSVLVAGGCLEIVPEGVRYEGEHLAAWLEDHRIESAYLPPFSLEDVRARRSRATGPSSLRRLLVGVEPISERLLVEICAETPGLRLINGYGPTEATVCATFFDVDPRRTGDGNVPIGRRMPGSSVYLMERDLRPVPRGSLGELVVGGAALARGYLARSALTAERFVPDPFSRRAPGARLYRTGDMARYLPDGNLQFRGRRDFQVKLRGYRIELGEIESLLVELHDVDEAVVLVRGDRDAGSDALVAYVVPRSAGRFSVGDARDHLRQHLPAYMVPSAFVELESLPRTPSGKLDRRALPEPSADRTDKTETAFLEPRSDLERRIAEVWRQVLGVDRVGLRDSFFDLGGHSLLLVRLRARLQEALGRGLSVVDLFRFPTVGALAEHLQLDGGETPKSHRAPSRVRARREDREQEIAIIGMAGRFPKARDLAAFWRNLREGVEAVTFFSDEELIAAGVPAAQLADPHYVKAFGQLADFDLFDAGLFGMSPREAQITDPQHRIFLECAWEALEDAGCDPQGYRGAIGVFGGVSTSSFRLELFADSELMDAMGEMPAMLGNNKDFLATRLSYKLDLKGPSVNVQTACSTSLVATHFACRSLIEQECDMALAGGVTVTSFRNSGYYFTEGGIVSSDGRCRPFDARAEGTVGGNGVGIVVLKRLSDALADGDAIRAVIRGSAINNDGAFKVGFTAPSVSGQARAISEALELAGVSPDTIGYVETHGTATALGDSVEIAALKQSLGTEPVKRCALGAVKSNIGHTDAAAGVAGLIKAVLCLQHGEIPPTLHFETPHPELDLEHSPFYVNPTPVSWPRRDGPRRAGVSSFGLGGTNAHAILEEAPEQGPSGPSRSRQLLVLSAATESSLTAGRERLAERLCELPAGALPDVAHTLQVGRRRLEHRLVLVCRDRDGAVDALVRPQAGRAVLGHEAARERPVAMLFPGLGDHYPQMGRGLYEGEPAFRAEIDRCSEMLAPILDIDLRTVLYPGPPPADVGTAPGMDFRKLLGRPSDGSAGTDGPLAETRLAQPAVFVVEYALARLWMEWGVQPETMIGYSLGEYVAACLAGVLSLEDALRLVAERARLIDGLPAGEMLAVMLPEAELRTLLGRDVSLAATNTYQLSVAAGPSAAIEALSSSLLEQEIACQRLRTSHAFHSTMMEPIAEAFAERVGRVRLHAPSIPYLSNVTGTWITADEAVDPGYWVRHLCSTVRFAESLERLLDETGRVLLEVGPGQGLSTSARQHSFRTDRHPVVASMRDAREEASDVATILSALGQLWLAGSAIDWRGFSGHENRRRVPLPTYAFDRQRYWPAAGDPSTSGARRASARRGSGRAGGKRTDLGEWFYRPTWEPSPGPPPPEPVEEPGMDRSWWIFADEHGLAQRVVESLAKSGRDSVVVRRGGAYRKLEDGIYEIRADRRQDYVDLLADLGAASSPPGGIAHFWSVTGERSEPLDEVAFEDAQTLGLQSLVFLGQALAATVVADSVSITVFADGLHQISGRERLAPEKATLLGAAQVLPQEYGHLACGVVGVELTGSGDGALVELADRLAAELVAGSRDPAVAYHRDDRWVRRYSPFRLDGRASSRYRLRQDGVYLLIGGLGRIGLALAEELARVASARLVVTARSPLPPPGEWDAWLAESDEQDPTRRKIERLRACEKQGGEVLVLQADVTDRGRMRSVVDRCRERFGRLDGVFHLAGHPQSEVTAPLEDIDARVLRRNFGPKVRGVLALEEALAGEPVDFCVLFSSLSSVLGGLGFTAYSAANAFLDAFAESRAGDSRTQWISIDWDGWFAEENQQNGGFGSDLMRLAMTGDEGLEALRRVLSLRSLSRVVVSTGDLEARIATWLLPDGSDRASQAPRHHSRGRRPQLTTAYEAPRSGSEEEIVELWQTLLGIDRIGRHDDYFELGGDSLLATQMLSRLRGSFKVQLSVRDLFGARNVARLAALIESREQETDLSELESLLDRIEGMEESEAVEAVAARAGRGS